MPRPSLKISLPIGSSRQAGLASSTLANALTRRWPKGERLIAEALDVAPEKTGPSRYRWYLSGAARIRKLPRISFIRSAIILWTAKTVFYYRPSYHELSSRLHEMLHDLKEAPDVSGWSPFYRQRRLWKRLDLSFDGLRLSSRFITLRKSQWIRWIIVHRLL